MVERCKEPAGMPAGWTPHQSHTICVWLLQDQALDYAGGFAFPSDVDASNEQHVNRAAVASSDNMLFAQAGQQRTQQLQQLRRVLGQGQQVVMPAGNKPQVAVNNP